MQPRIRYDRTIVHQHHEQTVHVMLDLEAPPAPPLERAPIDVVVVLDRSGSMDSIASDVVGGFNSFVAEQAADGADALMTLIQFDSGDAHEVLASAAPITEIARLTSTTFVPRGGTPLYDAMGHAIADATIRAEAGEPEVLIYNAGYLEGRDLPAGQELLEYIPVEMFDTAHHIASRGPFLVAKEVLPAMRKRGSGSFFFSNNAKSLRGTKRNTGESLYYPRVMMRTLAQVLTEEYSEHGVHVANVVIDGLIDSPGTRALPRAHNNPDIIINPMKIAEAFFYLHTQDKSCWTHELQLTPFPTKPSH